ncbi:MAG: NAD-dependent epimerase/dehydratase family protein [Candidatus Hydrogenedentes bacterium]|nr:NAD-dependent epimerase/dehydratase family protein [Candidatus Hydrogenedentota bacterium]
MKILVTGGAGFVGSNICIYLKEFYPDSYIVAFDNLHRRGSELNLSRLKCKDIEFIHGDIRNPVDLLQIPQCDWIIECSAEPSVLAGYHSSPHYLTQSNLMGAINCLDWARENHSAFLFLSTSRVYPYTIINSLPYVETETRFIPKYEEISLPGISPKGISEKFPLEGARTLYGATKLSAEIIALEYAEMYDIPVIINRCGIIAGPWQMGKVDQGVVTHWLAHHISGKPLTYIGFGGSGKQVRDLIDIQDLCKLIIWEIENLSVANKKIFNVGGGTERSFSLCELTNFAQQIVGKCVDISYDPDTRPGDVSFYLTDTSYIESISSWKPEIPLPTTLEKIAKWLVDNSEYLKGVVL